MNSRTFGIKSGDIVLLSGSLLTATLLKWATGSRWNHAGIGVWIKNGIPTIDSGELYILEINTAARYDIISNDFVTGTGFTHIDITLEMYNMLGVRTMDDSYRLEFISNVLHFHRNSSGLQFNSSKMKFIRGWLGISGESDIEEDGVFCTEMMAMAYSYCLSKPIDRILRIDNLTSDICIPSIYTYRQSPSSSVFPYPEFLVKYRNEYFLNSVIILVVVTIIVVLIAIALTVAVDGVVKTCKGSPSESDNGSTRSYRAGDRHQNSSCHAA